MARAARACVVDAYPQYPPEDILKLLAKASRDGADLVVASRYCQQGRGEGLGLVRGLISTALPPRRGCCSRGAFTTSPVR
jgi:hypothetical protein